jgi:hypothetical protein
MRLPYEISCIFAVVRFACEISCYSAVTRFPYFLVIFCCLLHNFLMRLPYEISCFWLHNCDQSSSAIFSCALTVNVFGLLFLRQCLPIHKLVHHRFAAIGGTGVQYWINLRLCQLTFARALLENIVHQAGWRRLLP